MENEKPKPAISRILSNPAGLGGARRLFIWTVNYSAASSGLLFKVFSCIQKTLFNLASGKDLAVSPLCCHRYIPSSLLALGIGTASVFTLARHCSHLEPRGRRVLPSTFLDALRQMEVRTFLRARHKQRARQSSCRLGFFVCPYFNKQNYNLSRFFVRHSLNFSIFSVLARKPLALGCPPKVISNSGHFFISATLSTPSMLRAAPCTWPFKIL